MIKPEKFSETDFDNLISRDASEEELIQFAGSGFKFLLTCEQLRIYISDPNVNAYKVLYEDNYIGHAEINVSDKFRPKTV